MPSQDAQEFAEIVGNMLDDKLKDVKKALYDLQSGMVALEQRMSALETKQHELDTKAKRPSGVSWIALGVAGVSTLIAIGDLWVIASLLQLLHR